MSITKDMQTIAANGKASITALDAERHYHETIAKAEQIRYFTFVRWMRSVALDIERQAGENPSDWEQPQSLAEWIEEIGRM